MDVFRRVELEDREWLQPLLFGDVDRGCEYTFGNIFSWRDVSGIAVAHLGEGALVRFERKPRAYLFPINCADRLGEAIDVIERDAARQDRDFAIYAAMKEDCDALESLFPGKFDFRGGWLPEYVYNSSDLIELPGGKYHQKRNHISRFERDNDSWKFSELTAAELTRVLEFNERWYAARTSAGDISEGLREEHGVSVSALENFEALGLQGGFLEDARNEIVAFSLGEPINGETFCVHFEKADILSQGAYAVINNQFSAEYCKNYRYINREDDAGDAGLGRAKMSYYPAFVKDKYMITEKS